MPLELRHSRLRSTLLFASSLLAITMPVAAQVTRIPLPDKSTFPISEGVWVGKTLYLSGMLSPSLDGPTPGDTKTQTIGAIQAIDAALKAQKLTLGDVVLMHVYLAGDPAKGGKMDFSGFMAGYTQFFGTREQPHLPARSAMQVAALADPTALVEIEVIAVKP